LPKPFVKYWIAGDDRPDHGEARIRDFVRTAQVEQQAAMKRGEFGTGPCARLARLESALAALDAPDEPESCNSSKENTAKVGNNSESSHAEKKPKCSVCGSEATRWCPYCFAPFCEEDYEAHVGEEE
jgi:hypothetical protein